jgi:hypothetical protein
MMASISNRVMLMGVSPAALSAYARTEGWTKVTTYGDNSDVYAGEGRPEIIVPRTRELGDYERVVAQLVDIFARVAELDDLTLYRDLATADRDVIRSRVASEGDTVDINEGANLIVGSRDMLLATACSLRDPRPAYRAGANRDANDFLKQVRLGQTEPGSFVVTLLSPVIVSPVQALSARDSANPDSSMPRQMTMRLHQALLATRRATEETMGGETGAFSDTIPEGASANLCEALVQMIEPFPALDVSVTWARTSPMSTARDRVRFTKDHVPILSEAGRSFRNRVPQTDMRLFCTVHRLQRDDRETDGTVTLSASIEGRIQSVTAVLNQSDYNRAIDAHRGKDPVIAEGDLDRFGQRWRLLNPRIVQVLTSGDAEDD